MYELTEEQKEVRRAVRELAEKEVKPKATETDEKREFPHEVIKILVKHGIHLLPLPEEYGGYDSFLLNCIAIEELAKADGVVGSWLAIQSPIAKVITASNNKWAKEEYLRKMAAGKITAITITEPEVGSDVASMRTKAIWDGDTYIINGSKTFISHGLVADFFTLWAKVAPEKGLDGLGTFAVDRDMPGIEVSALDKMGMHGMATAEVYFDDVRVPKKKLLGGEKEGMKLLFESMNPARLYVGSVALGISEAALDYATWYAKERVQFDRIISEYQAVQMLLAEMAIRVEASRALLYRMAWMMDNKKVEHMEGFAALTKTFITERALEVTNYAMDVLGGHGYMHDHPIERMMRDVKATHFFEGTNYINRLHIARALLRGRLSSIYI